MRNRREFHADMMKNGQDICAVLMRNRQEFHADMMKIGQDVCAVFINKDMNFVPV
jgi:hypothetical protein